jgi:hypothetical protein
MTPKKKPTKEQLEMGKRIDNSNLIRAVQNKSHEGFKKWLDKAEIPNNRKKRSDNK